MLSVAHLEFSYTQAPRKMKSLVMCTYLGAIWLGNVFTAGMISSFKIRKRGDVKLKGAAYFLFLCAMVIVVTAVCFLFRQSILSRKNYIQDEADTRPPSASRLAGTEWIGASLKQVDLEQSCLLENRPAVNLPHRGSNVGSSNTDSAM